MARKVDCQEGICVLCFQSPKYYIKNTQVAGLLVSPWPVPLSGVKCGTLPSALSRANASYSADSHSSTAHSVRTMV